MALPEDPVFIVGFWRTGSTLLHSRLAAHGGFASPRTWQCFNPSTMLLMPPPKPQKALRPMDTGVIHTFSEQEDEFAALLLGEPSLYRIFIDPRRTQDWLALPHQWMNAATPLSDRWQDFLKGVLKLNPGRLLLKSPNHTFRLPWLAKRFPKARFVWLSRDREDLLRSNLSMVGHMIERYGLWNVDTSRLEEALAAALKAHDEILDWARAEIPDRLSWVSFKDILANDPRLLDRIHAEIGAEYAPLVSSRSRQL